ncbi:ZIP family metal transporter [Candidatus Woesearchaeota archaeon]|jgi:zinc and cadmium transporter|nr:ZIP family metal transporter [Candidatus Woesearchaeota archaeon]
MGVIIYTFLSVIIVSLISFVGILFFLLKKQTLKQTLLFLVSLSAGSLFGGAFLHLLPEAIEDSGFTLTVSLSVLSGVLIFFLIEKYVHWHHCHDPHCQSHKHHLVVMNLVGDGVHNFIDGLIIAVSYIASIPLGIATTIAVILHEVPQEIGDFGVLLYSGLKKSKALLYNLLSALVAIVGAIIGLIFASETFINIIIPFAAGGFIYIAGSDLIPELHKECGPKESFWHIFALILGISLMVALKFLPFG